MPWKSDKQRKWAHATGQPWASSWDNKYNEGGSVMGLLDKRGQDMKITVKKPNGASVTYHSPEGSQVDMKGILGGLVEGPDMGPAADNVTARLTPGEFVLNRPAAQNPQFRPMIEEMNNWGKQQLAMGGYTEGMKGYADGGSVANNWMTAERSDAEAASGLYGYATDDTPIVSSGHPGQMAEWALSFFDFDPTPENRTALENLAREVIADFGRLPKHEQEEWGSVQELYDYYVQGAIEDGEIHRGSRYAEGGQVKGSGSAVAAFAEEFGIDFTDYNLERADAVIKDVMKETGDPAIAAGAVAEAFNIDPTDANLQKIEMLISEFMGMSAPGYAGGGEVSNHLRIVTSLSWLDTSPPPA